MAAFAFASGMLSFSLTAGLVADPPPPAVGRVPLGSLGTGHSAAIAPRAADLRTPERRPPGELHFVVKTGDAAYLVLGDLPPDAPLPAHGEVSLGGETWSPLAVAAIADADIPEELRAWRGRQVVVNEELTTEVVGFALVAALEGDPLYSGGEVDRWTGESVLASGKKMLAARLAAGESGFARDAATAPFAVAEPIAARAALRGARRDFLASEAAFAARADFSAESGEPADFAPLVSELVVRHPLTGSIWISLHLEAGDLCGGAEVNLWGLYRVDGDTAHREHIGPLERTGSIETLIDIDGDGRLEVLTRGQLGIDRQLFSAEGALKKELERPFYGCPC